MLGACASVLWCFAKLYLRFCRYAAWCRCESSSFSQPDPASQPARTMISYLLNALSAAASTASGAPGNDEELRHGGDVSPRGVDDDVEDQTGKNDSAAGCTGGDGPTPSHDGNSLSTSREVKTNNSKTDKTKEYVEGDGSDTKFLPEVMAVAPDGKQQPNIDGVATNNDERMDTDKIVADVDDTCGTMIAENEQGGKGSIENDGKKKRKRGGTGTRVSSSVTTTPAAITTSDVVNKNMNHPVQNHGSELSILPKTTALSTQLQIHAALMSTRTAIRRAYTHSHLGGVILISSSRGTFNNNAGIVTGRNNAKRGGNDDIGGHCILAIRYCGFKGGRDGTIEIEYARTSTLERAERFLGCCTGAVGNICGESGDFDASSPPQWKRHMLPSRVMSSYCGQLENTCAYQGYSCMESGVKVYEGVLP